LDKPFALDSAGWDGPGWQGKWQGAGAISIFYTEFDGRRYSQRPEAVG
jgi:hypothetical protein